MEFEELSRKLQENFTSLVQGGKSAILVADTDEILWEIYLNNLSEACNPIYKTRREHDCSSCRHFIRSFGNLVIVKPDMSVHTLWGFDCGDPSYQLSLNAMDAYIKLQPIKDLCIFRESTLGTPENKSLDDGKVISWSHFSLKVPKDLIITSPLDVEAVKSEARDVFSVFKRSLETITPESSQMILDLIDQNSIYRGQEWKYPLQSFKEFQNLYQSTPDKDAFCWYQVYFSKANPLVHATNISVAVLKIRNTSFGTLLQDVSGGRDLDESVSAFESLVAPSNYKRPKALFTPRMLDDAKKALESGGYLDSLGRRHATLDDLNVTDLLYSNKTSASRIKKEDVFDLLSKSAEVPVLSKFSRVTPIQIEDFLKNILPEATNLEVYMDPKYTGNLFSLITAKVPSAKTMFKWDNPFSWAYAGNVADSMMRDRVKKAGGRVEGLLRFTIQWNDLDRDENDLDAHCIEPNLHEVYFADKRGTCGEGSLDVDITHPTNSEPAVENIIYTSLRDGAYQFFVRNYSNRGGRRGFRAEIEFNNTIYTYNYDADIPHSKDVSVAVVTVRGSSLSITHSVKPSISSIGEIWGLKIGQFIPVSAITLSPNYWRNNAVGNKHYFFVLEGCTNPEDPNGFYNEYLKDELLKYKHVLEALGGKVSVASTDDQVSGLGFSSTKHETLLVRVKGSSERLLEIRF